MIWGRGVSGKLRSELVKVFSARYGKRAPTPLYQMIAFWVLMALVTFLVASVVFSR